MNPPQQKWDVALVMPRWLNYSAELANGIAHYAEEHPHFRLCELPMEDYGDHRRLDQARVDGVLVWADARDRWVVDIWDDGVPIVNCGSDLEETDVPMVATASVSRQAVEFLAELARPSVAYVCPDPGIHNAYRLIAKHACEGITVNEVVHAVHLSRQTFHKRFVDAFGCTPAQKIRSFRLGKAKELLATTDLAVARIADFCGFSEQSKFYNFFKREANCSPSDWRDKCRNDQGGSSP